MLTESQIEAAIGPIDDYAYNCHVASTALVNSDLLLDRPVRVARGFCEGVGIQHSWVVLGDDCYSDTAPILDVTAWSYDSTLPRVWVTSISEGYHTPHGRYHILRGPMPTAGPGEPIHLDLPASAQSFLDLLGPLDALGWARLAGGGMLGWDSRTVIDAMCGHPELRHLVPVDIVGMLTDRNPLGAYLPVRSSRKNI